MSKFPKCFLTIDWRMSGLSHSSLTLISNSEKLYPINRALFETWGNALADYNWETLKPVKPTIVKLARKMMLTDNDFLSAISTSTSTASKIELRFSKVKKILTEVGLGPVNK
jgi:hypothetical protein